jgi:hypothetical protein
MNALELVLEDLGEALPAGAGSAAAGLFVGVTEVALELPIESRIDARGLALSPPRGRYATGFVAPQGRLRFVSSDEREESAWPR